MAETINWSLNVQVIGGPRISDGGVLSVEAYEKIEVKIERHKNIEVKVQPTEMNSIRMLLIISDIYSEKLLYKVNQKIIKDDSNAIKLDAAHLLLGSGAVELIDRAPTTLYFCNQTKDNATIQIFVARMATPQKSRE